MAAPCCDFRVVSELFADGAEDGADVQNSSQDVWAGVSTNAHLFDITRAKSHEHPLIPAQHPFLKPLLRSLGHLFDAAFHF